MGPARLVQQVARFALQQVARLALLQVARLALLDSALLDSALLARQVTGLALDPGRLALLSAARLGLLRPAWLGMLRAARLRRMSSYPREAGRVTCRASRAALSMPSRVARWKSVTIGAV